MTLSAKGRLRYVVVTAAKNEEAFITKTLETVVRQTIRPERWVVVDDDSTDRTGDIVESYLPANPWIELVRRRRGGHRDFAGKVHAFNDGLARLASVQFELIANVDADVALEPDHFEFLLARFAEDPTLGVAGTAYTQPNFDSVRDSFEGEESVAGPLQVFRYECLQDVGGYVPNRHGGVDWIAVTTARRKGWKTRNFPQRRFHHFRTMGSEGRSAIGTMFFMGQKDYILGSSPLWHLLRAGYRTKERPIIAGGAALLFGYWWAAIRRLERSAGPDLVKFYRHEQMRKLRRIFLSALTLSRIEKFSLDAEKPR